MYQKDPLKMRLLDVIENVFFLLEKTFAFSKKKILISGKIFRISSF